MRTTIDLPDHLLRLAKARAAMEGTTLKDLVTRCLEWALRDESSVLSAERARRERSEPPVLERPTRTELPVFSNAELQEMLDLEEAREIGRQS